MAGYQQQDAHEFFCFVLEMMAATAGAGEPRLPACLARWAARAVGSVGAPADRAPAGPMTVHLLPPPAARCAENITQRVFGGTLRSDLICSACGHVSTSHEQFSHLSLDIPPPQQLIAPTILPRPTGGAAAGSQATVPGSAAASPSKAGAGGGPIARPSHKSHKKGASKGGAANHSGGSKASRLVGAAKVSHERALARKAAADQAAAAAAGAGEAPAATVQQQLQQQLGPGGLDTSSEIDFMDLCASDSSEWLGACSGAVCACGTSAHLHGGAARRAPLLTRPPSQ